MRALGSDELGSGSRGWGRSLGDEHAELALFLAGPTRGSPNPSLLQELVYMTLNSETENQLKQDRS